MIKTLGREREKREPVSVGLEETNADHDTRAAVEPGFRGVRGAFRGTPGYLVTVTWLGHTFSASASPAAAD